MPESHYFEIRTAHPVIDKIVDSREVKPANYIETRHFDSGAYAGLLD